MKTRDLARLSWVVPVLVAGTHLSSRVTNEICKIFGVRKGIGMALVDFAAGLKLAEFVDRELAPGLNAFEKGRQEPKLDDGPDECAFLDEEIGEKDG